MPTPKSKLRFRVISLSPSARAARAAERRMTTLLHFWPPRYRPRRLSLAEPLRSKASLCRAQERPACENEQLVVSPSSGRLVRSALRIHLPVFRLLSWGAIKPPAKCPASVKAAVLTVAQRWAACQSFLRPSARALRAVVNLGAIQLVCSRCRTSCPIRPAVRRLARPSLLMEY
jgi:hypothetical protein